jgi:two-component system, cell cycle response regulator
MKPLKRPAPISSTAAINAGRGAELSGVGGRLSWLTYAGVTLGFGMLAFSQRNEGFFPEQTAAIVAIVLAALVTIRQLLAQRRLLAVQEQLGEANDHLAALASTDALTGLKNHRSLIETIELELMRAQRHQRALAVLFVDVDAFKTLNDTFGHLAGDEALRTLGELTRGCVRGIDTVGRWGGEEFVAVLAESDAAGAIETADRIRAAVAEHGFEDGRHRLSCSIGVASYPADATEFSELIQLADTAMYSAKRRGGNRTVAAGGQSYSDELAHAIIARVC